MVEKATKKEIRIIVEGGNNDPKANADTVDNSAKLREAFQIFFQKGVHQKEGLSIKIDTEGSYTKANKTFKSDANALLLIDLDNPPTEKAKRLAEFGLVERKEQVFFMVQTMESWILSQPLKIEKLYAEYAISEKMRLADDEVIKEKNIQLITSPDKVLNQLLGKYFQRKKGDKIVPLKYGKLKTAPELLAILDIQQLRKDFEDVENLLVAINQ